MEKNGQNLRHEPPTWFTEDSDTLQALLILNRHTNYVASGGFLMKTFNIRFGDLSNQLSPTERIKVSHKLS